MDQSNLPELTALPHAPVTASDPQSEINPNPSGPVLLHPIEPRLRRTVTVLCVALFTAAMGIRTAIVWVLDRSDLLEAPEQFLEHVTARKLELEEYADQRSGLEEFFDRLQGYERGDMLEESIRAYSGYLSHTTSDWPRLYRTLAILYGEAGRREELRSVLSNLDLMESEAAYVEMIRAVYLNEGSGKNFPAMDRMIAGVHPDWARDRLLARVEGWVGAESAAEAETRLARRAAELNRQLRPLVIGILAICAAGAVVGLVWLLFGSGFRPLGEGINQSPWGVGRGAAVLVRAALAGVVIAELTGILAYAVPGLAWLAGLASLLASLPLIWLGSKYLLGPYGLSLSSSFGLRVPASRWLSLALFTIVIAAVDLIGSIAISAVLERLEIRPHWAETPMEDVLWSPWWLVGLGFWDAVVWAPIFEEIGCRGFIFVTVRRRFSLLPAALVTGLIFGAAHFYSIAGFLTVAWSGILWSLAYDRSRSLVPGMISHSIGNMIAISGMVLLYRV